MKSKKKKNEDTDIIKLTHTNTPYDLGIIKALLGDNNIPFIIKETGSDQYMRLCTGRSLNGADILIPAPLLPRAEELLESIGMLETSE